MSYSDDLRDLLNDVFTLDGNRFTLAAADALNWLTAGLAGGWLIAASKSEASDWLLTIVVFGAFLFSGAVRYYTLGIENYVESDDE